MLDGDGVVLDYVYAHMSYRGDAYYERRDVVVSRTNLSSLATFASWRSDSVKVSDAMEGRVADRLVN